MLTFIRKVLADGCAPCAYKREEANWFVGPGATKRGNEATFTWFRHRNSRILNVKTEYNVTDEEHAQIESTLSEWRARHPS